MPRRFRKSKARKGRKPRRAPKARLMPTIAEKGQTCRVVETFESVDLLANSPQQSIFTLAQFARASNIAPNFKWYRAAKVIYTYDPLFNTFQDGAGNANASKPYLYVVMNRTQLGGGTLQTMQKLQQYQVAGARPIPLIKQFKLSYRPNWCSPGLLQLRTTVSPGQPNIQDYSSNGLQAQYGWLATPNYQGGVVAADKTGTNTGDYPITVSLAPPTFASVDNSYVYTNMVVYNGHEVFADQKYTGGDPENQPIARVTVTVLWEFKGAQNPLQMSAPSVTEKAT